MKTPDGCILCIGDIDVDIVIAVPEVPGPDEKINGSLILRSPGGMAANVAVGLARLETPVRLVAAIGDDVDGRYLTECMQGEGVEIEGLILRDGVATFSCIVMVSDSGEKSLVRVVTDAYLPRPEDIGPSVFDGVSHLHMTLGSADLTGQMFQHAARLGIPRSLDLEAADIRNAEISLIAPILEMTDILFCSENAFATARAEFERHGLNPDLLRGRLCHVVTKGAAGAVLFSEDGYIKAAGHSVTPLDTTGAGDGFVAAFLHARFDGLELEECLKFANAAGAMATLAVGAQTALPDALSIRSFIDQHERSARSVG